MDALKAREDKHRVIDLPSGGGQRVAKDPIWEALSRGDDFSKLLHSRPLYLLGRSLLVDQEALYSKALQLYATRNKIAHRGEPPSDDKYFPTTSDGAKEALHTAVGVMRWFGDSSPYHIYEGFVEIEDGAIG